MTLIRVHPDELLRDAMKKSVSDCRHFGRSFSEVKWHCLWHVLCILLQYALPCHSAVQPGMQEYIELYQS